LITTPSSTWFDWRDIKKIKVKNIFIPRGLKILFFTSYTSYHIADGTLFMAKDENAISVHKLTKVHANTIKKLTRVLCPIKNKLNTKKIKNIRKQQQKKKKNFLNIYIHRAETTPLNKMDVSDHTHVCQRGGCATPIG
jgi:hypothetical protein